MRMRVRMHAFYESSGDTLYFYLCLNGRKGERERKIAVKQISLSAR
jgi:hypothetical protein